MLQQGLQLVPSCPALLGGVQFTKYIFFSGTLGGGGGGGGGLTRADGHLLGTDESAHTQGKDDGQHV